MGLYDQLDDDDKRAISQLARYLIETQGNRFYEQNLIAVRNHIAGNNELIRQAHKFQEKMAELMHQEALALADIAKHAEKAASDPVKEMMRRYQDPNAHKTLMERIKKVRKQRGAAN